MGRKRYCTLIKYKDEIPLSDIPDQLKHWKKYIKELLCDEKKVDIHDT